MLNLYSLEDLYLDYFAYQENFTEHDLLYHQIVNCQDIRPVANSAKLKEAYSYYQNTNYTEEFKRECNSSGSTGPIRPYFLCCDHKFNAKLERFNKTQSLQTKLVRVLPHFITKNGRPGSNITYKDTKNNIYSYLTHINTHDIDQTIDAFKAIPEDRLAIWAQPCFWLYCNSFKKFQDYLIKSKITIVSSDYTSFFKKKRLLSNDVHVNDCMIDYSTGANFYTCKYGGTHIMPIYCYSNKSSFNLFNLYKNNYLKSSGDKFKIHQTAKCKCGITAYVIDFAPHEKYLNRFYNIKNEISESLRGNYFTFQIVNHGAKLSCFYSSINSMPPEDEAYIRDHLNVVNIYKDAKIYTSATNNKLEPFYTNADSKAVSFVR